MFELVAYEVDGRVATISHNRPESRNAESRQLLDEMDAAFRQAARDPAIGAIILGGKGDHFSAGHDIKEAQVSRSNFTVEERWEYERLRYFDYALNILDCPKPTIAAVQGACVAGAFMVANMCDIMLASDDAYFSDPVTRTMGAAAVEVLIHPWVLGQRKAREMLFTGERVSAEEGHRLGMVNRVVPRAELHATAQAMAAKIADGPEFVLQLVKRSLNRTADIQGLRTALQAHFDTHQLSHVSEAFRKVRDSGLASAIRTGKAS
ncbi:MAG: enoyl-CoA hydratase [Rhizobiaceae bacterium]|nr:enoyl-CoA hydratase [Rhizobiaceae bacterium]